jgi:hypothetical protein
LEKKYVIFNGVRVVEGWPEKVLACQEITTISIGGVAFDRIKFGEEDDDWGSSKGPCHDCAAASGQFHFIGCDVERCPLCKGQAITCECDYDDNER